MATISLADCSLVFAIEDDEDVPFHPRVRDAIRVVVSPEAEQETLDALDILLSPPRTCLSCGAKTNTAGELPCGH